MVIIPVSWMSWNLEDIRPGDAGGMARLGFWSPSGYEWVKVAQVMSDSLRPRGLHGPWNSLGQNTGMGNLSLLQGIFPPQGSNPGLPHCRRILYQLSHQGSPRMLEWAAYSFSSGSSQPRNPTGISCIAGGFFTNWAIRDDHPTPPHPSGWAKHLWSSEIQLSPETWFWRQVWCPWHWWIWTREHVTTNLGVLLRYIDSRYAFFF